MLEVNLRRSLLMSQGSFGIFLARPLVLTALILCFFMMALPVYQRLKKEKNVKDHK